MCRSPHARIIDKDLPLAIEFERVRFCYQEEGPWVLSDVSFQLEAGMRMALVDDNGSGKTTLVKLLLRYYGPTEGQILINGVDLQEIDLESYYGRIGVIFQQFAQYEGRIREQVGYGEIGPHAESVLIQIHSQVQAKSRCLKPRFLIL